MASAVGIVKQCAAPGRQQPLLSITGFIFGRAIEPDGKHTLRCRVPFNVTRTRRKPCIEERRYVELLGHLESNGIGMDLSGGSTGFDLVKVRFPIVCGVDA